MSDFSLDAHKQQPILYRKYICDLKSSLKHGMIDFLL